MRKTIIFGVITVLIGLISCVKDNETKPDDSVIYDTIKPLDYFPAYPGSYWIYDDNDTLKVADQYEKYIFNSAGYTAEPDYDTLILPKLILNGVFNSPQTFAYVNGYSISQSTGNYRDPAFKDILSVNQGDELIIGGAVQGHQIRGRVVKTDTTIEVNGSIYENVIITIHFDNYWSGYGMTETEYAFEREYFAKDVGLIKREIKNYPIDTEFKNDIELIKYEINR